MHKVSEAYKKAMNESLRQRGYIQISLGAINQEAQGSASASDNTYTYWSNQSTLFTTDESSDVEYATLEQNLMKADGSLLIMPEEDSYDVIQNVGVATDRLMGAVKIDLGGSYEVKGLTVDFGRFYPTELKIITSNGDVYEYLNDTSYFVTNKYWGDITSLTIVPVKMNGKKRLRIRNILIGVGLNFSNNDVSDSTYEEYISAISEETPYSTFTANILDPTNHYNVDSKESFINFLEIGQQVSVSMGMTLEDETVEWITLGQLSLCEWSSTKGMFTFKAQDTLAFEQTEYSLGNKIYTRSALFEAQQILQDMGLSPDDYILDNYLASITLTNPLPVAPHKECLQLLANACRCYMTQDSSGRIVVRANFANVVEPEDVIIDTYDSVTPYAHAENILVGTHDVYSEFQRNFLRADGKQHIMSEDGEWLDTGYISNEICDAKGIFKENPKISLQFEAGYTFYGLEINFDGNPPEEMIIHTFHDDVEVQTETVTNLENNNLLYIEFDRFDKILFEFSKGYPNNRVLINKISFGDYNDYRLSMDNMYESPYGTRETPVKEIQVKIYSFEEETDKDGNIKVKEVEDDVWYTRQVHKVGDTIQIENQLISDETKASYLAEWLGNHYKNNVNYEVTYRGDARLNASDIIHMDSDAVNNLQVEIERHTLTFNGAWNGSLTLRRAMRIGEE